jgi:hypothetical protein
MRAYQYHFPSKAFKTEIAQYHNIRTQMVVFTNNWYKID